MAAESPPGAGRTRPRASTFDWTPTRVTALYLLLGGILLVISDVVLVRFLDDPLLARVQAVKAILEVLATAAFIYVLTRRSRASLRRTNETLARQREELGVLHRVLRHNLRNALTVISGSARSVRRRQPLDDDGEEHCERIERRGARMADLVEHARRIRRITEREDPLVELDPAVAVRRAVERCETDDAVVDVSVPEGETVAVNWLFEDAVRELVDNAIEHNEGDRAVVGIETEVRDERITISITDDGPGIPDPVRDVFDTGEFDQLIHVSGMGLWFAYWTVSDAGGTFEVDSLEGGGSIVRLAVRRVSADVAPESALPGRVAGLTDR